MAWTDWRAQAKELCIGTLKKYVGNVAKGEKYRKIRMGNSAFQTRVVRRLCPTAPLPRCPAAPLPRCPAAEPVSQRNLVAVKNPSKFWLTSFSIFSRLSSSSVTSVISLGVFCCSAVPLFRCYAVPLFRCTFRRCSERVLLWSGFTSQMCPPKHMAHNVANVNKQN